MKPTRLFFLDAVRAFAILMMLQGHFIDSLLNPIYRDTSNTIYNIWAYFRGITAPTFFTITGLVFVFLLLKAKEKGAEQERIKKGMHLGNTSKGKVKIIFEDVDGLKKVETTIWGFTDKNVILKKTTIIPIRCVHEVKFY